MQQYIIIQCPHCNDYVYVFLNELNCKIFRHGIYKNNYEQIDPHLPKEKCEFLIQNKLIYGCGKPFKVIKENNYYISTVCEYI
jgi:hypothetical protein